MISLETMTTLATILAILAALALGLLLAFLPMKMILAAIARNVTEPIRQFIERQRERRKVARDTPDRRRT